MPAQTHTCSCWSVIAQVRVINCWPRIGYSPHGVSRNVLLIHSSFSPSCRSRDPLCKCELVQQGCSDVDEDITSTDTTTPPTAIVPSIPPPEARPAIHKFYTRRDRNVLLIRNLGVEDKDIWADILCCICGCPQAVTTCSQLEYSRLNYLFVTC